MTDKQIIIDGVDVSGCHNKTFYKNDEGDVQCKCYRFEDADSDTLLFGICKQHPHCYYKQLKRKEQECERLKNKLKINEEYHDDVMENMLCSVSSNSQKTREILELQQQLDQLKEEKEELQEKIKAYDEVYSNHDVLNERNKLKQTLTEIKKIAKNGCYDDCGMPLDELSIILQKISEVEDET